MDVGTWQIKLFADGADLAGIRKMSANPLIKGFTTNPTLLRKAGVEDYLAFAHEVTNLVGDRPISLEVLADDFSEMEAQARLLASIGGNVFVKIPVTDTAGRSSTPLLRRLTGYGVKVNVTAVMRPEQVEDVAAVLDGPPAYVSVFAGRIADTGRDPLPVVETALEILRPLPNVKLIWASPRELLNIVQAEAVGCHVITATHDILGKLALIGKDLADYSLDTVRMFYADGVAAGFHLPVPDREAALA